MKKKIGLAVILSLFIVAAFAGIKTARDRYYADYNYTSELALKNPKTAAEEKSLDASLPTDYTFVSEPWTGDNQPYHAIRVSVDQLLADGQNPNDLLLPAKIAAHENPTDPKAQFRWAYIAYQAETIDLKQAQLIPDRTKSQAAILIALNKLNYVREALAEASAPHAYDYSRIRFLVGVNSDQAGPEIRPLGMRLLHHDPTDYTVESIVISLLQPGLVPGDMALGLALVKDAMHRYPNSLEPHEQFCGLYQGYWSNNGFHRADADKAIAENKAYLALLPANYPFRRNVLQDIQHIQILQDFEEEKRKQK